MTAEEADKKVLFWAVNWKDAKFVRAGEMWLHCWDCVAIRLPLAVDIPRYSICGAGLIFAFDAKQGKKVSCCDGIGWRKYKQHLVQAKVGQKSRLASAWQLKVLVGYSGAPIWKIYIYTQKNSLNVFICMRSSTFYTLTYLWELSEIKICALHFSAGWVSPVFFPPPPHFGSQFHKKSAHLLVFISWGDVPLLSSRAFACWCVFFF